MTNAIGSTAFSSINGTLVKTGPNSFTVTGVMLDLMTDQTYSFSASGTY